MLREYLSPPCLLKVQLLGAALGASQNYILALMRIGPALLRPLSNERWTSPLLGEWLVNASPGKLTRLAFLCNVLGLEERTLPHDIYYQLLHRTASAVIEAKRFKTDAAVMLVHSFSPTRRWFDAFAHFASLFGCSAEPGKLMLVGPSAERPLYLGWACGDVHFLTA
jgi:hypothetical protein